MDDTRRMTNSIDLTNATLEARVVLISPESGGRQTPPLRSDYRGQFFYDDRDCDAVHVFDVVGDVPLGREVTDFIFLLNPVHHSRMKVGMPFLIREGPHTIGYGLVEKVRAASVQNSGMDDAEESDC